MGLGVQSICIWDGMKQDFLKIYQDYCNAKDLGEEIFKMIQKEGNFLDDYVERL
jgi:hypothetical protein